MNRRRWMRCWTWRAVAALWVLAVAAFGYFLRYGVTLAPMGPVARYAYALVSWPALDAGGAAPTGSEWEPIRQVLFRWQREAQSFLRPQGHSRWVMNLRFSVPTPATSTRGPFTRYSIEYGATSGRTGGVDGAVLLESMLRAAEDNEAFPANGPNSAILSVRRWMRHAPADWGSTLLHTSLDEYGLRLSTTPPATNVVWTEASIVHYPRFRVFMNWRTLRLAREGIRSSPSIAEDFQNMPESIAEWLHRHYGKDPSTPFPRSNP